MRITKTIALSSLFFVVAGAIFSFFLPPLYEATVEIVFNPSFVFKGLEVDPLAYNEYLQHQADMFISPGNLGLVIDKLNLNVSEKYAGADIEKKLAKQIKIDPVGNSLIIVSARSESSYFSARIAQELVSNYIDAIKKERYRLRDDAVLWIMDKSSLAEEIAKEENEIERIKSDKRFPAIEKSMLEARTQIKELKKQRNFLVKRITKLKEEALSKDFGQATFEELLDKPQLRDIKNRFNAIERELRDLSQIYTSEHPTIFKLEEEKQDLKQKVMLASTSYSEDIKKQIGLMNEQIKALDQGIGKFKKITDKVDPLLEAVYIKEKKLAELKTSMQEISKRLDEEDFYPLEIAIAGMTPQDLITIKAVHNHWQSLIVSLLLGIFVGILLSLFAKPKVKVS